MEAKHSVAIFANVCLIKNPLYMGLQYIRQRVKEKFWSEYWIPIFFYDDKNEKGSVRKNSP